MNPSGIKRRDNMRKSLAIGLLPVLLMATIVVATGCGGGGAYATPEDTVNTLLDAYEDLDTEKMLDCLIVIRINIAPRM